MLAHMPRYNILNIFFESNDMQKIKSDSLKGRLFDNYNNKIFNFNVNLTNSSNAILYTAPVYNLVIPEIAFEEFEENNINPMTLKYYLATNQKDQIILNELRLLNNIKGPYPPPYNLIYDAIKIGLV